MERTITVFITGPGGSGKSTVAHEVVKHVGNCVNIVLDHVKHFISHRDWGYESKIEGPKQWRIVGENLALLTKNYRRHGYDVIINGYLAPSAWEALDKEVNFTHKILLLPKVEVAVDRDSKRQKDRLDEKTIRQHYEYFSNDKLYDNFVKIDSSDMSVEETASEVMKILGKKKDLQ